MKTKLITTIALFVLAAPIFAASAMAGDAMSPLPGSHPFSLAQVNTVQCDPPCVAPEICCKLSGLEAACVMPDDCFAGDTKSKSKSK